MWRIGQIKIVNNRQNDEMLQNSKIYKAFDKNLIEKEGKNHYTNNRERVNPAQKIFMEEKQMKKIIALVLD